MRVSLLQSIVVIQKYCYCDGFDALHLCKVSLLSGMVRTGPYCKEIYSFQLSMELNLELHVWLLRL